MPSPSSLPLPRVGEVRDEREIGRRFILGGLFVILAGTIAFSALAAFDGGHAWDNVQSLLNLLFPAELALIGAAVAFYMTN